MRVDDALVGKIILIGEQNRPITIKRCGIHSKSVILCRYEAATCVGVSTRLIQSSITIP